MVKKKALITGIAGQDGAFLSKLLLEKNYKVFGIIRSKNRTSLWRLEKLKIKNKIKIIFNLLKKKFKNINNIGQTK